MSTHDQMVNLLGYDPMESFFGDVLKIADEFLTKTGRVEPAPASTGRSMSYDDIVVALGNPSKSFFGELLTMPLD